MAYLGKTYKFEKHEKYDEFLGALGVQKAAKDAILSHPSTKSSTKLVKDGDTYTFTIEGDDGVKTFSFKSGVEFEQKIGSFGATTTITVDGNTIVQNVKYPSGRTATFKSEFSGNKLVVAATNSEWNGVAYSYYSA